MKSGYGQIKEKMLVEMRMRENKLVVENIIVVDIKYEKCKRL
jgi:hypothetical protein